MLIWFIDIVLELPVRFSFDGDFVTDCGMIVRLLILPKAVRFVDSPGGASMAFCMLVARC
jgi:hypothetical protein